MITRTWKFDPTLFDYLEMGVDQRDRFAALRTNTAVILGEKSEDEGAFYADHMREITANALPVITVPGTYHHLMFDEPLAVAMSLKWLALEWLRQDREQLRQQSLNKILGKAND